MSQIEQGQYIPHDGPAQIEEPLRRILSTNWPVDSSPLSHDVHVRIIEAVRDLKEQASRNNSVGETQLEL